MPAVATAGLVAIGRDKKIRTKPAEVATLRSSGLRLFYLTGPKDMQSWDYVNVLVRRWDDMEQMVEQRGPGPWFMSVTATGVRELKV
jgi:PIN like domain